MGKGEWVSCLESLVSLIPPPSVPTLVSTKDDDPPVNLTALGLLYTYNETTLPLRDNDVLPNSLHLPPPPRRGVLIFARQKSLAEEPHLARSQPQEINGQMTRDSHSLLFPLPHPHPHPQLLVHPSPIKPVKPPFTSSYKLPSLSEFAINVSLVLPWARISQKQLNDFSPFRLFLALEIVI